MIQSRLGSIKMELADVPQHQCKSCIDPCGIEVGMSHYYGAIHHGPIRQPMPDIKMRKAHILGE